MRFTYDPSVDAAYVYLADRPYASGTDLDDSRRIDYDADGKPIGIELLGVSHGARVSGLPECAAVELLLRHHTIPVVA